MKRTVLFLLTAVLLGFGLQSCDKEDINSGNNVDNNGVNNSGDDNGDDNGGNNGGDVNGGDTTTVQWVDLGLPSGLLWADRNVGADKPEGYGNYYAWGETVPKEVYDWTTYAYGNAYNAITKYCNKSEYGLNGFTDDLTTLEASDDAATVNFGVSARTPTKDEWEELLNNTTAIWTTRNGVYGLLLTASNGKNLFLPAASGRHSPNLHHTGEYGVYWSSTLYMSYPGFAWFFDFYSDDQHVYSGDRIFGFSVRAVRAK